MPQISVILITYNRSNMLKRMIDAVKAQTFQEYEVILINNGSTDDTLLICEQYANEDTRVKLINIEKNNGSAPARNVGLSYVTGKYVLMIDDDDTCDKKMFEHLYEMAEKYNADISVTGCIDEYSNGQKIPRYVYDELYVWNGFDGLSEFLKRERFDTAAATKLFKRSLIGEKRWSEGVYVDDIHFIYKLFVEAKVVVACCKPMYYFYKHTGNVSGFLSGNLLKPEVLEEYLLMQNERVEYISEHVPELTEQVMYARASYMISMIERIEKGLAVDCDKQLIYMKEYLREHKEELLGHKWTTLREENLMQEYVL